MHQQRSKIHYSTIFQRRRLFYIHIFNILLTYLIFKLFEYINLNIYLCKEFVIIPCLWYTIIFTLVYSKLIDIHFLYFNFKRFNVKRFYGYFYPIYIYIKSINIYSLYVNFKHLKQLYSMATNQWWFLESELQVKLYSSRNSTGIDRSRRIWSTGFQKCSTIKEI